MKIKAISSFADACIHLLIPISGKVSNNNSEFKNLKLCENNFYKRINCYYFDASGYAVTENLVILRK